MFLFEITPGGLKYALKPFAFSFRGLLQRIDCPSLSG